MGDRAERDDVLWILAGVELAGAGGRPRLTGITAQLHAGITGVVGPSGSGKTSLLNLLVGYEQPTAGTVTFLPPAQADGLDLFWSPADAGLWPHLNVLEHVTQVQPSQGPAARAQAEQLLAAFHLAECAGTRPARLSHGEQERLAMARAIATGARVLVLDEPFIHVDPVRAAEYWALLREHSESRGVAVVFSSHEPARVLAEATDVVCLRAGRILYHGPVTELYERPPSRDLALYLGEANWLTADEAREWLGVNNTDSACYRPHRLEVVPDPGGPLTVVSAVPSGPNCQAWLRHERTGNTARFVHRSPQTPLSPGVRVMLRLCALMLLCLLVCCSGGTVVPDLPVTQLRYHIVPPCGARAPAPRAIAPGKTGGWIVLDNVGRVLVFDDKGAVKRQWFMPEHEVGCPEGVCLLADGRIVVADTHYHRLVFFDEQGRVLSMLGGHGRGPGQFIYPVRVVPAEGKGKAGHIYVAEYGSNDRVQKFTAAGKHVLSFGSFGTGPGQFQRPSGLALRDGKVFVADAMNNRVQVFKDDGTFVGLLHGAGPQPRLKFPYDLVAGPKGLLYVVEYGGGCVTALSGDGTVVGRFGTPGAGRGQFATPWALTMDQKGRLVVCDTGNRRIVEVHL